LTPRFLVGSLVGVRIISLLEALDDVAPQGRLVPQRFIVTTSDRINPRTAAGSVHPDDVLIDPKSFDVHKFSITREGARDRIGSTPESGHVDRYQRRDRGTNTRRRGTAPALHPGRRVHSDYTTRTEVGLIIAAVTTLESV
jgi:hypothetical protein